MQQIYKILLVLGLLTLGGCSDPLPSDYSSYAGDWRSAEMRLLILADGSVSYQRIQNGMTTSINAPIKHFEGDDFVVGIGFFDTTFVVNQRPYQKGGRWFMVVDEVTLQRAEIQPVRVIDKDAGQRL
ncbi:hypothetical protein [Umboniibacter marinipuniceus]|uniref:Uncharacterized protein n=1 Tax=Umboniibacter marinipuniceus TaxID=569599 RepID=A0A3M0ABM2_9GAMM|nr:hypothetical protein [Umboniibacter marinipuniceus]RMA80969.1 hypothetical protein DFR27_0759 [Umboniibacter marinipuniceus]